MDQLSTTVSKDGDIIKIKPDLSQLKERGLYEIDHQRDIFKKGAMKNLPYNRNLILGYSFYNFISIFFRMYSFIYLTTNLVFEKIFLILAIIGY